MRKLTPSRFRISAMAAAAFMMISPFGSFVGDGGVRPAASGITRHSFVHIGQRGSSWQRPAVDTTAGGRPELTSLPDRTGGLGSANDFVRAHQECRRKGEPEHLR